MSLIHQSLLDKVVLYVDENWVAVLDFMVLCMTEDVSSVAPVFVDLLLLRHLSFWVFRLFTSL